MDPLRLIITTVFILFQGAVMELSAEAGSDGLSKFTLTGQFRDLFMCTETDEYYGEKRPLESYYLNPPEPSAMRLISDLKRLRISPDYRYGETLIVHGDFDSEVILSSYNGSYEFDAYWRPSSYNELVRASWEPVNDGDIYAGMKVHRLYAKISVSDFTLTLGRQQVRFGSGRLWNPLDILNPISPTLIEGPEEQKAADAARLDYYINDTTEITAAYEQKGYNDRPDYSMRNGNAIMRIKTTLVETDIALMGGHVARRAVCGADVSGIFFDGTLRGGLVCQDPIGIAGRGSFQGSLGYEYSFASGLYFLAEYFSNSDSLNDDPELKGLYELSFISGTDQKNYFLLSNRFFTYNSYYSGMSLGYDFLQLFRGELFIIGDIEGRGLFLSPSLKYNLMENCDVTAGMMGGYTHDSGKQSDFNIFEKNFLYFASIVIFF